MSDQLMELIKTRRSVRSFKPDAVPRELVLKIVEAASWAPSGSNQQPWRFIAVEDSVVRQKMAGAVNEALAEVAARIKSPRASEDLAGYAPYFTVFAKAPLALCVFSRPYDALIARLLTRYGKQQDAVMFRSSGHIQSCAAALQNALLMAHSLGLGSCWMTGPLLAAGQIAKLVDAEAGLELIAIAAIGCPESIPAAPARPLPESLVSFI